MEKPSPINLAYAAINIWRTLDGSRMYSEEYFCDDWSHPYDDSFDDFIVKAISHYPFKVVTPADDDTLIRIATVKGIEVGWTFSKDNGYVNSVWVRSECLAQAKIVIKEALWATINVRSIVMEKTTTQMNGNNDNRDAPLTFKPDEDLKGLRSQKADEYSAYLKRCMDAGVPRTILFYGPPGTGKSTIARAISDRLHLRTLRIRVEDISDFGNNVIFEAINLFEPDAVILDDLDRTHSQNHLLETLDRFHKHLKLVFATVNHRDALDDALQRPGRFDEICKIKRLDDEVIHKMLGEENAGVFEQVKDWPIAFIKEYVTRRQFMTVEEATSSMAELRKRVARLDDEEDDEDDEDDADTLGIQSLDDWGPDPSADLKNNVEIAKPRPKKTKNTQAKTGLKMMKNVGGVRKR